MMQPMHMPFWLRLYVSNDHFQMKEMYLVVLDWYKHLHAHCQTFLLPKHKPSCFCVVNLNLKAWNPKTPWENCHEKSWELVDPLPLIGKLAAVVVATIGFPSQL